jgi:hypothetical protein
MARPNWSRPPAPAADHSRQRQGIPAAVDACRRARFFEARAQGAAAGADATQLSIALQMVLMLEKVEYQMKDGAN